MLIVPVRIQRNRPRLQPNVDYTLTGLGQTESESLYDATAAVFKQYFPAIALIGAGAIVLALAWGLAKKFK